LEKLQIQGREWKTDFLLFEVDKKSSVKIFIEIFLLILGN